MKTIRPRQQRLVTRAASAPFTRWVQMALLLLAGLLVASTLLAQQPAEMDAGRTPSAEQPGRSAEQPKPASEEPRPAAEPRVAAGSDARQFANQKVCRLDKPPGSTIKRMICKTPQEIEIERQRTEDAVLRMKRLQSPFIDTGRGLNGR